MLEYTIEQKLIVALITDLYIHLYVIQEPGYLV